MKKLIVTFLYFYLFLFSYLIYGQSTYTSNTTSGKWDTGSSWTCSGTCGETWPQDGDHIIIQDGHTITFDPGGSTDLVFEDVTINSGGTLNVDFNQEFFITGVFTVNGTFSNDPSTNPVDIRFQGTSMDGTGSIYLKKSNGNLGNFTIETNGSSVASTAGLSITANLKINSGVTFTNNGSFNPKEAFTIDGTFINATNANLSIGGTFTNNGTFTTSASGNTVTYSGGSAQTIVTTNYQNLKISSSSTVSMGGSFTVNEDFDIASGTFDGTSNEYTMILKGNLSNNDVYTPGNLTILMNSTSDQSITDENGSTLSLANLTLDKSSGTLNLGSNVAVTGTLNMNQGDIVTSSYTLTSGNNTPTEGTITYSSGTIIGTLERYITSTGSKLFPIGTTDDYRPASINFSGSPSGSCIFIFNESAPGSLNGTLSDGGETLYNVFTEGFWTMSTSGSFPSATYDLILTGTNFSSFELNGATYYESIISRTSSGVDWGLSGTHDAGNSSSSNLARTGMTTQPADFGFSSSNSCTAPSAPTFSGGSTQLCYSTSDTYTISDPQDGTTYNWTVTGGTFNANSLSSYSAVDATSVLIDWGGTGGNYTITCSATNGCTTSSSSSYSVTVDPVAPASISGRTTVGTGTQNVNYSIDSPDGSYTYTWSVSGGTIDDATTGTSIVIDWGETAGDGTISISTTNPSCGGTSSDTDFAINIFEYLPSKSGLTNVNWNSGDSWNGDNVPEAGDNVKITGNTSMILNTDATVGYFLVEEGSSLLVNGNTLTVSKDITVQGDLLSNTAGDITLASDAGSYQIDGYGTIGGGTAELTLNASTTQTISTGSSLTFGSNATLNMDSNILKNYGITTLTGDFNLQNTTIYNFGNIIVGSSTIDFATGGASSLSTGDSSGDTITYTSGSPTLLYGAELAGDANNLNYRHLKLEDAGSVDLGNGVTSITVANDLIADVATGSFFRSTTNNLTGNMYITNSDIQFTGSTNLNGTTAQTLSFGSTGSSFTNLVINNSTAGNAAITTTGDVQVDGAITFTDGIVSSADGSNCFNMTAGTSTASTGTDASHVNGYFTWTVPNTNAHTGLIYPLGDGSTYRPIALDVDQADGTSRTYTATQVEGDAGGLGYTLPGTIDRVSALRYYSITQSSAAAVTSASVEITYNTDDGAENAANLRVVKGSGGTGAWTDLGGSGSADNAGTITSNNFTTFSDFSLGNSTGGNNSLPVELIEFTGIATSEGTLLSWSTATEVNNSHFDIERSTDGISFETIATVQGNGHSNTILTYDYLDSHTTGTQSYYRLKQVDFGGTTDYSKVISVIHTESNQRVIYITPNPASDQIQLTFDQNNLQYLSIINIEGKVVYESPISDQKFIKLDVSNWNKGVYFIRANGTTEMVFNKFLVK